MIKVLANSVSGGSSLPSLQMGPVSVCPHVLFSVCGEIVRELAHVSSSFQKDTNLIGLGHHPYGLI